MSITTVPPKRVVLLLAAGLVLLVACRGHAEETVSIHLTDGSSVLAEVHPRTNDEHLWLRFGSGRAVVLRAVAWSRVAEAKVGDKSLDAAALRKLAAQSEEEESAASGGGPQVSEPTCAEQARELLGFCPRVATVDFDAQIANWDQDVEFDGLVVRLFPLAAEGQLTSARGTLNIELVAARYLDFSGVPNVRGKLPSRIGQWSVAVDVDVVADNGGVFKLPFPTSHPEFDARWAAHGLVRIRFVVPGQGVFELAIDGVRVRRDAPLRDAMERFDGRRFLPTERTGFSKQIR